MTTEPAADSPPIAELGGDGRLNRGAVSWSLFQAGRDPYVILMTIYIFMPYVAVTMVGDEVKGQELISRFQQYAGWMVMATAPFLGASVDKLGPRKALLAANVILMVPLIGSLWFAKPDQSGLSILATMWVATAVNVLFSYTEVLHNSLLVRAAGLGSAHRASGLALSFGNLTSVFALGFIAWAFALPGQVDWSWVPAEPLFGLDPATHEPERVAAVLSAIQLAVGSLPLFLFTPDAPKTGVPMVRALASGAGELFGMLKTVTRYKDAVVFLISRMVFVDGMNSVLFFFGVLAAGVMKWGPLELLVGGVALSVVGVIGGLTGRWLDERLGPKRALQIEIFMSILGLTGLLGMKPDTILFFWSHDPASPPLWNGPVLNTRPDVVFLLIGFCNAIFITGQYTSSRTALIRLTPPAQTGAFFGVYALSGVATAWLAPMLVNLGTRVTQTQQGGFATIIVLLAIGLLGLSFVRGGGRGAFTPD